MEKQDLKQNINTDENVDCCSSSSCCEGNSEIGKSDDVSEKDIRCC